MIVKKLESDDFSMYRGFYKTLNNLSVSEELPVYESVTILDEINKSNGHIFVAIVGDEIICSVTLLLERKFIRRGAMCGHIEDVVTRKEFEGQGICTKVLNMALDFAMTNNCYKIILDCDENLMDFYKKTGFKSSGVFASKRFI